MDAVTQTSTLDNRADQKSISERITLDADELQDQKTTMDSIPVSQERESVGTRVHKLTETGQLKIISDAIQILLMLGSEFSIKSMNP